MESLERIATHLAAVRRRLRHLAALRAGLYALTAIAACALLAPLAASALPGSADTVAALAGVITVGAVGAALLWGVVLPARRWRRDDDVARYVGSRVPPIASDLLSAVELGRARDRSAEHFSPHLIDALVADAAGALARLSPQKLVPRRWLRRAGQGAAGAAGAHLLALLVLPGALGTGWGALFASSEPGPYGGARMSDAPLVGDIDITLRYPAYSGREPMRLPSASGDVRVMPGTTIEITTRPVQPAAAARILLEESGGDELAPVEMHVEDGELSAQFSVTEPLVYRFLLETSGGDRHVEAAPHRIEIEPDETPEVELFAPADELDVTRMKRIELAYIAEDDYGIDKIELVWEQDGHSARKELPVSGDQPLSAQSKFLWDLADVSLEPGVRVGYHIEVTDNDTVLGPNVGRSKQMHLRVFSPRERHEQNIDRQKELLENMLRNLGGRLVVAAEDVDAHQVLGRDTASIVVELGTLVSALADDELAAKELGAALEEMRERLDKLLATEAGLVSGMLERRAQGRSLGRLQARLAASDAALVAELEDDVILVADWIERQQMEDLLAIQDEIALHRDRLRELLKEYERTGDEELLAEIEREMKAIEKLLAQMNERRQGLAEDVLDRFVNTEAMQADEATSCIGEVRALLKAGDTEGAQQKMEECTSVLDESGRAMEEALAALRGDKFSEQERKFGELMNELADLARDQSELADAADDLWERYAQRADEMMRDKAREMRRQMSRTLEQLRARIDEIPPDGLTPFSREELDLAESRLDDVDRMLADGDIAEALAMARQAEAGLETIDSELDAALDEQRGPWSKRTAEAARRVKRAQALAEKLVDELESATPSPEEIMSGEDRRQLEQLRRRQQSVRERSGKLAERAEKMAGELPGNAGEEMAGGVQQAMEQMGRAEGRMRARDPSGSRQESRGAADKLEQAQQSSRGAARQQQRHGGSGLRDEPVRIPGADEYRAPEKFREDILDAMKKERAPDGFDDMVRRYYEELIK